MQHLLLWPTLPLLPKLLPLALVLVLCSVPQISTLNLHSRLQRLMLIPLLRSLRLTKAVILLQLVLLFCLACSEAATLMMLFMTLEAISVIKTFQGRRETKFPCEGLEGQQAHCARSKPPIRAAFLYAHSLDVMGIRDTIRCHIK